MREELQLARFAGLVPEDRMCVLTRFMVAREHRGTVAPVELVAAQVRLVVGLEADLVFLDCEPHMLTSYTMLGFRPYCGAVNDQHRDLLVPLVCLTRDRAYLESLNSPLLGWGAAELDPAGSSASPTQILEHCDGRPTIRRLDSDLASRLPVVIGGVLSGLEPSEVASMFERSQVIELEPGQVLIREGAITRNVFIVLDGTLAAEPVGRAARPGDVLGEVAFLTGKPRTMDVVAGADGARVISVGEGSLRKLIDSHSRVASVLLMNLARVLAERLASSA